MTMTSPLVNPNRRPWYREPWPWILMAGPLLVVIASVISAWLAIKSSDGLVTDDYYKKGLAAHQTLGQSAKAISVGLSAGVRVTAESLSVSLTAKDSGFSDPDSVVVTVSHPTRAGLDQTQSLSRGVDGRYTGKFHLPASGHWIVLIEDDKKTWRLEGNVILPATGETQIGGERPADIRNQQ